MSKKLLLVGALSHEESAYSYSQSFVRAFEALGYAVTFFNYRHKQHSVFSNFYTQHSLKKLSAALRPNMTFLLKTELLDLSTYHALRQTTQQMIGFHPDNPFCLWNHNGSAALLKALPLFDCYTSWSNTLQQTLVMSGAPHSCFLPFGWDEKVYIPQSETNQKFDVSFVGTWEPKRQMYLEYVITRIPSLRLGIWGNMWKEHIRQSPLQKYYQGAACYADNFATIVVQSKINLNFLRVQNNDTHNMRTFEIPALKGLMLAESSSDHSSRFFIEGISIVTFESPEALVNKILFLLANELLCKNIASQGHAAAQGYTLSKVIARVIKMCPMLTKSISHEESHDHHTKTKDCDSFDQKQI